MTKCSYHHRSLSIGFFDRVVFYVHWNTGETLRFLPGVCHSHEELINLSILCPQGLTGQTALWTHWELPVSGGASGRSLDGDRSDCLRWWCDKTRPVCVWMIEAREMAILCLDPLGRWAEPAEHKRSGEVRKKRRWTEMDELTIADVVLHPFVFAWLLTAKRKLYNTQNDDFLTCKKRKRIKERETSQLNGPLVWQGISGHRCLMYPLNIYFTMLVDRLFVWHPKKSHPIY